MISKRAVAEIPPLTLLPVQLATSVVALGVAAVAKRPTIRPTKELRQLAWLGMLNPGLAYALGIAGLAQITANMSVLLWATEPVLILLLAVWLLRERTSGILAVSLALALGGVALVVSGRDVGGGLAGVALTMGGVAACAVYTILVKRWLLKDSTIAIVALQQAAALLFSLALLGGAAVLGLAHATPRVSALGWISAIGSGLVYYAAAFWLYLTGLRHVPATIAGGFISLVPLFGITSSYLLLGERLNGRQWFGALLILFAVAVIVSVHISARPDHVDRFAR